jgi:hypothetical protein
LLAPLRDPEGAIHTLALDAEGALAHVAVPLGSTTPRPVVVGVHGAGDRADWSCSEWYATTSANAFVVCPHGANDPRWKGTLVWRSASDIAAAAVHAMAALEAHYGAHVATGPAIYASWSEGATLAGAAVASAARLGLRFDAVVLVEVGYTPVDARAMARSFSSAGVRRVLVSCSSWQCRGFAPQLEAAGRASGLAVHVVDVGLRGHWFDAPVFAALAAQWGWLTEGDARWSREKAPRCAAG